VVKHGLVPILCGSAFKNKGFSAELLDCSCGFICPTDRYSARSMALLPDGEEAQPPCERQCPFSALAFKVWLILRQTHLREECKAEPSRKASSLLNSTRIKGTHPRLILPQGRDRKESMNCRAGDLGGVLGPRNTTTVDTSALKPIQSFWSRLFSIRRTGHIRCCGAPKTKGDRRNSPRL